MTHDKYNRAWQQKERRYAFFFKVRLMPRKSGAALAVVTPIQDHRPPVPDGMPEAQADIWTRIVNRLPNGWFRPEHREVLTAYCQHACIAEQLARQVEAFRPEWLAEEGGLERLDRLTKMLDREHRAVVMLARSMRLTHQAQYDTQKASRAARKPVLEGPAPWERHV